MQQSVTILGGGLSGMAAAYALAVAGGRDITLIERGPVLGGLAGSFERDGHFYPLGYHHILHRDRTLLYFLDHIGALPEVRWRRISMLFELHGQTYDLAHPVDFARFPMAMTDKLRFVRLMLYAFRKSNWDDWLDRSGQDLVDAWGGPGVRQALFEPLSQLKFGLPCADVSGAWLGARLYFREGSAPLGYIPHANWTKTLCDGLTAKLRTAGVRIVTGASITQLHTRGDRLVDAELADGTRVSADTFVSTLPTETYLRLLPGDASPGIADIRYTALLSAICATRQPVDADFYWMHLASLNRQACGVFLLSSLNPTIGAPGDTCVNFVTHLRSRSEPLFARSEDELMAGYLDDYRHTFGADLEPFWHHLTRIPMYSPVFGVAYRNPPPRSSTWRNLYFAGNYRTFPSIVSTGTALASGLETADAIFSDRGLPAGELKHKVEAFRLAGMPREAGPGRG